MLQSELPVDLVEAIQHSTVVPFVGAGFSRPLFPSWRELLQQLILKGNALGLQMASAHASFDEGNLYAAGTEVKRQFGANRFEQALLDIFKPDNPPRVLERHRLLIQLRVPGIITTNYDNLLERALWETGYDPLIASWKSTSLASLLRGRRLFVCHLHGIIDDLDTLVFGEEDRRRLAHGSEAWKHFLSALLQTRTILYLGYSLFDPHFQWLKEEVLHAFVQNLAPSFALMPNVDQATIDNLWRLDNIAVLPYEVAEDDLTHSHVEAFLGELVQLAIPREKRKPPALKQERKAISIRKRHPTQGVPSYIPSFFPSLAIFQIDRMGELEALTKLVGEAAESSPLGGLLTSLKQRKPQLLSVVVEREYVDKEYLSLYSTFYSRLFHHVPSNTLRLHFFTIRVGPEHLWGDERLLRAFQADYVGFVVVRPQFPPTISRAIVVAPSDLGHFGGSVKREYAVNLAGLALKISGIPYMESDHRTFSPPQAAIWMAHLCLTNLPELRQYTIAEIAQLGSEVSRAVDAPIGGMTIDDVFLMIQRMGFSPEHHILHNPADRQGVEDWLIPYVRSGYPVLMYVQTQAGMTTMVVIGVQEKDGDSQNGWSMYVHDPINGAYLKAYPAEEQSTSGFETKLVTSYGQTLSQKTPVLGFTSIRPKGVLLDPITALHKAKAILSLLATSYRSPELLNYHPRAYLVDTSEFKLKMGSQRTSSPSLVTRLRGMPMPRFAWVIELCEKFHRHGEDEWSVAGAIILDAADTTGEPDFVAIHIPGVLIEASRGDARPISSLLEPIILDHDQPHPSWFR